MRIRIVPVPMLAVLLAWVAVFPGKAGEAEDDLKSVTVLSFLRYSTWPQPTHSGDPNIGVVGRPAFAKTLGALLEGKAINGRPLRLLELKPGSDLRCCDLVYFATDKKTDIEPALKAMALARALTIGEDQRFLDYGGTVSLQIVDGHMAFEVNLDALDRTGVDVSSKLLRLGQIRRRRGA